MSILIKGMEIPEDCIDCFAETYNECMVTGNSVNSLGRPDWCPLVKVPKHGRLIDADAFRRRCLEAIPYGFANEDEIRAYNKILGLLKEAPTIIEAEE